MTPEQLIDLVAVVRPIVNSGKAAWLALDEFLKKLETRIDQGEPMNVPLTQAQVDAILAHYVPIYNSMVTNIEAAGDALGSDNFSA